MNLESKASENATAILELKMESRRLWSDYVWAIRSYSMNSVHSHPSAKNEKDWVVECIKRIGDIVQPHFGTHSQMKLTQLMYSMFLLLNDKINSIKSGEDVSELSEMDLAVISSMAEFFAAPSDHCRLPRELCAQKIELLFCLILNMIISRAAHEWEIEIGYQKRIIDAASDISDIIVKGIIIENPKRFIKGDTYVL